jgi:predicted MPP superfamily phosphohydrolase
MVEATNIFSFWFVIVFLLFQTYLACDLIGFMIRKLLKHEKVTAWWKKIYSGGILAFTLAGIYLLAGYLNAVHVSFTDYEITSDKLRQGEQLKVAMIADLHLGTTMGVKELAKYCEEVSAKKPDVVFLVGDIFDERSPEAEIQKTCELFGAIESTYGTYYVYGNHDLGTYRRTYSLSKLQLQQYFTNANVKVLDDEVILLSDKYYLIGRSALSFTGNNNRSSIKELINGLDPDKYMIVLDHQPKELELAADLGIDLLVSGHTHGGQLWPVGLFSRLFHIDELTYGEEVIENMHAIVTSGIAGWGYSVKTGAKSEIVMIEINGG